MSPQNFLIVVILAATATIYSKAHGAELSAADCALLNMEYGVIPPGCVEADPTSVDTATARNEAQVEIADRPQLTKKMRENHVLFPSGGLKLDDAARAQLIHLVGLLSGPRLAGACLKLVGHSDRSGLAAANRILSAQRAQTVAEFLSAALGKARIAQIDGVGFDEPLRDFSPAAHENRRVAIYLGPCFAIQTP